MSAPYTQTRKRCRDAALAEAAAAAPENTASAVQDSTRSDPTAKKQKLDEKTATHLYRSRATAPAMNLTSTAQNSASFGIASENKQKSVTRINMRDPSGRRFNYESSTYKSSNENSQQGSNNPVIASATGMGATQGHDAVATGSDQNNASRPNRRRLHLILRPSRQIVRRQAAIDEARQAVVARPHAKSRVKMYRHPRFNELEEESEDEDQSNERVQKWVNSFTDEEAFGAIPYARGVQRETSNVFGSFHHLLEAARRGHIFYSEDYHEGDDYAMLETSHGVVYCESSSIAMAEQSWATYEAQASLLEKSGFERRITMAKLYVSLSQDLQRKLRDAYWKYAQMRRCDEARVAYEAGLSGPELQDQKIRRDCHRRLVDYRLSPPTYSTFDKLTASSRQSSG